MFPGGFNTPFYSSYGAPMMGMGINAIPKSGGLFSRLFGLGAGARGVNWAGLLNNASKTLGVINQAVPLIKQVGPIYNNMKSMLRVASLFKDETDPIVRNTSESDKVKNSVNEKENTIINENYSSPNFFI